MIRLLAISLSIIMQFAAAFIAFRLTRVTKYRLSWILISIGFFFMAIKRLVDLYQYIENDFSEPVSLINDWLSVVISVLISLGVIIIPEIFSYMRKLETSRNTAEKRLLNAILNTEEKERARFAKDLHDGLGPVLSTIKLSVSAIDPTTKTDEEKEILVNLNVLVDEAIESIKNISNNLSPYILNHFGLASAFQSFIDKINKSKGIQITFQSNLFGTRFDENLEVVLYRAVCELINNALKHSKASFVKLNITMHEQIIDVLYDDDGIGFDVDHALEEKVSGMGLQNIISRIKSINGYIHFDSFADKGLKVFISVNTAKI